MKYSTAVIACTAILCASTTIAAPSSKPDSSSYLQRRGNGASKTLAEIAAEAKRIAASEAARRLAAKVAKEVATQQGQKALDEAKKEKRSADDMDLAVREYLEARGNGASKTLAEIAAEAKRIAASEAARRLAAKVAKEVATQQGQKALDEAKKEKRSVDDMDLAVREYLEARGNGASKTLAEIAAEAKRIAASEAARRLAAKVAKEVATQQGQKALDEAKKEKRSVDDMDLAVREYLEARGNGASKTAAEIAAEARRIAASEAARRLAAKVAKEVATQQGQKALDEAKKEKRSADDMDLAVREYLEARGNGASKTLAEIAAEAKRIAASEAARRLAAKVAKEVATQQGQKALDEAKKSSGSESTRRSLEDSELTRREFVSELMGLVERELEAREYGVFNDLD